MNRSMRPPHVEQARALLVLQSFVLLLGLLAVVLSLQFFARMGLSGLESNVLLALLLTLAGGAAAGGLAARFVGRGHPVGWVLGLLAQLAVLAVVTEASVLRLFLAVPALILLASAGWITVVLLHPEVRAHLLRRGSRTAGH